MTKLNLEVSRKQVFAIVLLLIGLVTGLTFYPLIMVRFSTADDVVTLSEQLPSTFAALRDKLDLVHSGGRLSYWGTTVLGMIRVLVDSQVYQGFLRISSIAATFAMVALLSGLALESFAAGALVFVGLLLGMQNWWGHHIVSAFPFNFHVAFAVLLLSFVPYALRRWDVRWSVVGAFLFFLSGLCYELFIPYVILYPLLFALVAWAKPELTSWTRRLRWVTVRTLPYAVSALCYAVAYVIVRHAFHNGYDGVEVAADFSLRNYLLAVWKYSVSSLPPNFIRRSFGVVQLLSDAYHPIDTSLRSIFENMRLEWFVRELLAVALVSLFFRSAAERIKILSKKAQLATLFLVGLTIFLPNLLLSLSNSKQQWAIVGIDTYSGSFFSAVSLVVFLLFAYGLLYNQVSSVKIARYFMTTVLALLVFVVGTFTDLNNYFVSKAQANDYLLWRTMRSFFASPSFDDLPENSLVYAPSLWQSGRFWPIFHPTLEVDGYWDRMALRFTGKKVHFLRHSLKDELQRNPAELPKNIYQLEYGMTTQGRDSWLALGRLSVDRSDIEPRTLGADAVKFLVVSGSPDIGVLFSTQSFAAKATVTVDGRDRYEAFGMNHFIPLPTKSKAVDFLHREYSIKLDGTSIDVKSMRPIVGSELAGFRSKKLIDYELVQGEREGCFDTQRDATGEYQWCQKRTTILVSNNASQAIHTELRLRLFSGIPLWHIHISGLGTDTTFALKASDELTLPAVLEPGVNILKLSSDDAAVPAAPDDPRALAFGVRGIDTPGLKFGHITLSKAKSASMLK